MKLTRIRIQLTAILMAIALLAGACSAPAPTNQANVASNAPSNAKETAVAAVDSDCSGSNINEKRAKVQNGVGNNVNGNPKLKKQREDGLFSYEVTVKDNHLEMTVSGVVQGDGMLDDLAKAVKPFVKGGCVQKVTFKSNTSKTASADGFVWLVCEAPNIPCPNGECAPTCPTGVQSTDRKPEEESKQ